MAVYTMIVDEKALLEKLRRIEALHAGATTPGERVISQVFEQDTDEAEVREDQKLVGPVGVEPDAEP